MKKILNRMVSILIVTLIVLLSATLGETLKLPETLESIMSGNSIMAHASSYYGHNVSYNGVTSNYDNGSLPSGLNYCYENEIIYFNFSAGTDVYIRKATYHLTRNGKSNYLTGDYTPEKDYFRFCNFSLSLPDGSYSIYWDVQYSSPSYSSKVGSFTTDSYSFKVYDPEIIPSKSTVSLNIDGTKTATVYMTCHGGGSGNYVNYTSETSYCTVSAGEWDGDRIPFTITATGVGSSTLNFNLRTSGNTTIATTSVTVNVTENTYTLSYSANGGSGAPSGQSGSKKYSVSSTIPTRPGFNFLGWSTSCSATSPSYYPGSSISLSSNITLYAVWGQTTISSCSSVSPSISYGGQVYWYKFTPSSSGTYVMYSTGNSDTYGYLYNSSGTEIMHNDDDGDGNNFRLEYNLTGGTTYYYGVKYYSSSNTGSIPVKFGPVYTISYNANGGSNAPSSQKKDWGKDLTLTTSKPERPVYTFLGWSTSSTSTSASYQAGSTFNSNGNYTLYAVWVANPFTVHYNANGGTGAPAAYNGVGPYTISSTIPTRPGYNFLGWGTSSTSTSASYQPGASYTSYSNINLYAVWGQTTISSGSSVSPSISYGGQVYWYKFTPSSSGTYVMYSTGNSDTYGYLYNSSGTEIMHNDDDGDGNNFRLEYNLTGGTTYYYGVKYYSSSNTGSIPVKFGPVYTISYNANGGSNAPSSQKKDWGKDLTISSTIPTKPEYTFLGWSTSSSSSTVTYKTGDNYSANSNITLYSVWKDTIKPTCSIGVSNKVASSQTATLTLSDNIGVVGYYWGTSSSYNNNSYTTITSTTGISVYKDLSTAGIYYLTVKDATGNLSSTVSITMYLTTLNTNGGSVSPDSVLTKSGSSFTLPTPKKDKYSYVDWNEKQDGSGSSHKGIYTVTSSKTFYAQYSLDYHTVSFNANSGKNAPNSIEYNIKEGITLPSALPTKEFSITYNANGGSVNKSKQTVSCKFEGWDTNANGTGLRYQAGKFYKADNDETLFAQWSNQSAGNLETATRPGYTFKGWYTAASGGTEITASAIISKDTIVYAQWTANKYTVTYDANKGVCSQTSKEVTYASSYGTLPIPSLTGYSFLGWYDPSDNLIISSSPVSITANHTLKAHWNPISYTITFNANGGVCSITNKSVTHDKTYGDLPTAFLSGYNFKGWFTQATGGKQIVSSNIVDGTVTTLYAQWTLIPTYTISFDANGGKNTPAPQIKTDGVDLKLTEIVPTKRYTLTFNANGGSVSSNEIVLDAGFNLWIATDNTTYAKGGLYKKDEATVLKAKWNNPQAGNLPIATKEGYQFDGWYSGSTKYSQSTIVSADTTLTAHWKANTYTVSFYNGTDLLGSTVLTYDKDGKLSCGKTPNRSGYQFVGWEFSEDKKLYQEGQNVKNLTKENGKNLVFKAAWQRKVVLEDLTYSFYNNNTSKGFGYPEDYIIPEDSYYLIFGKNILSRTLISNSRILKEEGYTWGGNCFGMSTTTGLFNSDSGMNISDFDEFAMYVSDLNTDDINSSLNNITLTQYIESMQVSQYYSYIQRDYKNNKNKLSELCNLISKAETTGEYPIIALFGPSAGHAVVGYNVEKISNSETWIHIYDCNYPSTARHITLYTNAKGEFIGWRYNIGEGYDDWTSTLKEDEDCFISFIPYEHYKLAWEYRGKAAELTQKMKIDGVDPNADILELNSTSFVVKDFDGNIVCKAENGEFTSYNSDTFELLIAEMNKPSGYLLMLPADYYTIENKDTSIEYFELNIVNTNLGATVSTSADKVSIAVDDEYDVNNIVVKADKGEKYELCLLSSMNNGYETITLSGIGDGTNIGLSCTQGQVDYSIQNSTNVTLTIDGKLQKLNQTSEKEIISLSVLNKPNKIDYVYKGNNTIDMTGLSILVNYADGTSETVTDLTKITGKGLNTHKTGKQTITITYEGTETSYDIQVKYTWWQWIIRILLLGFLWY